MILTDILEYNAKTRPLEPALAMKIGFQNKVLTYRDVYDLSMRFAYFLKKVGVKKGDNVILIAPNSPYWICVFWGTLLRGAVIVPLNTQSTPEMVKNIVRQSEPKIVIKYKRYTKLANNSDLEMYDIESVFQELEDIDYATFNKVPTNDDTIVQILYTSGTTGEPKGVLLTNENIYSNIRAVSSMIPISSNDEILSILPLSHVFEQVVGFLVPYRNSAEIIYAHSPAEISNLLKEHKITKMIVVPEFLRLFLARIQSSIKEKNLEKTYNWLMESSLEIDWKPVQRLLFFFIHRELGGKLKMIASGGAALDPEIEKQWDALGIKLMQGYGLTETSPVVTMNTYKEHKIGSVGKPIPWTKVKIAEDGEILVKGPNVTSGYYKNEKKTKDAFTDDGWFKTGDIGYFDEDGFLFIKGRKKYMILGPGGQNVYPEDIESKLNKINGVKDSCVLGLGKPGGRVEIHAVLIVDKCIKDVESIIEKANSKLATYQQITAFTIWKKDDFPKTPTRKVKRDLVEKEITLLTKKGKKETGEKSPLVELIAEITGYDEKYIGGGTLVVKNLHLDSITRLELVTRIEEKFAVTISERDIGYQTKVKDIEEMIRLAKPIQPKLKIYFWQTNPIVTFIRWLLQWIIIFPFTLLFVDLKTEGMENLENLELPVIFMPNHVSEFDALVLLIAMPFGIRRKLAFAAAADLWYREDKRNWVSYLGELIYNAVPFYRKEGANFKHGFENVGIMLDRGFSVAVYPEGAVSPTEKMEEFKKGAGLIATEMDCTIIPVKTTGLDKIWGGSMKAPVSRGKATLKFGKPIRFSKSATYEEATKKLQEIIDEM